MVEDYFNPTMEYGGREFQIRTDVKIGCSWGEMEELEMGTTPEETEKNIRKKVDEFKAAGRLVDRLPEVY